MADNITQMAKEYKELLSTGNGNDYFNQIINLEESQLDMLNALNFYSIQKPQQKKIINYCINLIYQALDVLAKLSNMENYTPDFRNPYMPNSSRLLPALVNAQIDIFVLIDKARNNGTDELRMIENTKLGLLALLK